MSFDRDAWVSKGRPDLAPRALALRDRIVAEGAQCSPALEMGDDDDAPDGICLTMWLRGDILGCASLTAEGLSFFVRNGGAADRHTDDELVSAVRRSVALKEQS